MKHFRLLALLALIAPAAVMAQTLPKAPVYTDASSSNVMQAGGMLIFCSADNGVTTFVCTGAGGGGGGGGGDASAANQTTGNTIAATTRDEIGAITGTPLANTLQYRLEALRLNQTTQIVAEQALAGTVGTRGATAPTTAQTVQGVDPAGVGRGVSTDATGGLVPSAAAPASTRYTLTASTITNVGAASTGAGIAYKFQVEAAALTADVFICYAGQSTTCSATVHDDVIPSGTAAGTRLNYEWPVKTAVYLFSTGTPVINVTRSTVN